MSKCRPPRVLEPLSGGTAASIPSGSSIKGTTMRGTYRDFLQSPYWRALRKQVIAERRACEECGCHNNLQIHHHKYDKLGTYEEYYHFYGLTLLCRACHAEEHGLPAEERTWKGPEGIRTILAWVFSQIPRRAA